MRPYYDHGGITIYLGDCLEVLPTLDAASIDAVVTDPPYGTTACAWDTVIPFAPMWAEIKRLVKPRAAVALFGSQPFTSALVMSNPGWFKYEWVWRKNRGTGFMNAPKMPIRITESICVFGDAGITYNPQGLRRLNKPMRNSSTAGGRQVRGDLAASVGKGSLRTPGGRYTQEFEGYPTNDLAFALDTEKFHDTQKPVDLLRYLILTYTNPGDLVLDFTMGSGTTLVAAKHLGRRAIGIEMNERYCEIAAQRLSQEVMAL